MLQQRGQMRVTKVVFFESPYQLIAKYFLMSCKLGFFIFCNNVCFVKKVVKELMEKNDIGEESDRSNGNDGSNSGSAAMTTMAVTAAMAMKKSRYSLHATTNLPFLFSSDMPHCHKL